ncbi:MAG: cation-translocating P-type ATPase [Acidimicrobiales bacterium]
MRLPSPGVVLDPVRRVQGWLGDAAGRTSRRSVVVGDRAHVEVRGVDDPDRPEVAGAVKAALERLDAVDWAEVDAVLGRVVIAFDPDAVELDDLVSTVEDVEDAQEVAGERFPHDRPPHPADVEPIQRQVVAVGADVVAFGVAIAGQALHLAAIPAEIPGLISLADSQPRLRRQLEQRLGPPATDVLVSVTAAIAQALGQGPVGLAVDISQRSARIAEQASRRQAWLRREPELIEGATSVRHPALRLEPRGVPLPKGPVERYTDGAAIGSLGLVATTLAATRSPRRAVDLVLVSAPKAATLGREVFGATLDIALSRRGLVVMDPAALRRLDRVSVVAIDARLAASEQWAVDRIEVVDPAAVAERCAARARALFDPARPTAERRAASWTLTPFTKAAGAPRGTATRARELRRGGHKVLGLWRGDRLQALVAITPEPVPAAATFLAEAAEAEVRVVLAGGSEALAQRLGGLERWAAKDVAAEIRAEQAAGQVVAYASGRAHTGLHAADLGIGVESPGRRAPTGAHLILAEGMLDGVVLLRAIKTARSVSTRSALLAAAGAGTGTAWAMLGPSRLAASRAMLAINLSTLVSIGNGAWAGLRAGTVALPAAPAAHRWHELEPKAVLALVGSRRGGLREAERSVRHARVRTLDDGPVGWPRAVLEELANPLTPVLVVGAGLSAAIGSLTDAGLVLGVVGVNALVGGLQRTHTERALGDLEATRAATARTLVDGGERVLPADQLVVGDVVHLEAGDTVPADCRILSASSLEVDESSLTGESLPVAKAVRRTPGAAVAERASMLYEGTIVAAGTTTAVVVALGVDTEAGRSAAAAGSPPPSGVEQRLGRLTAITLPVTVGAGMVATGLGFVLRRPLRESVGTGVSLMVAAVPEGLPALATLAQIAAARRLAARQALVRNPRAIEALGRVRQVCFDKTGTLTEGTLEVVLVSDGERDGSVDQLGTAGRTVLAAAFHATPPPNGGGVHAHATDGAVAAAADAAGIAPRNGWAPVEELPFESRRGLHAVLGTQRGKRHIVVKGAPEVLLPRCEAHRRGRRTEVLDAEGVRRLEDHVHALARRGLRVLAVADAAVGDDARLRDESDLPPLTLLGFVALADPVRPSAVEAVRRLQGAGVELAMITGDHPSTAEAIAAELGMLNGHRVMTGPDMDELDDDELDAVIADTSVFARVTPLQKVRIVASYQRIGRAVAMTGDGANDAAAIRLADAGIALGGRGTAAARSCADVVVVDDRIETIVDAVVEGRAMWESVRAAVAILVGGNLGELGFTIAGTALGLSAPLNPRQLLLVNLLTDMAPALAIALREPPNVDPETLLHAGPDESLGTALTRDILVRAGTTTMGATSAFVAARLTGTPTRARTVGLAALVSTQLAQTVVAGGWSPTVLAASAGSLAVLVGVVQTPGLSQFFGCRPLGPVGWATALYASGAATVGSVVVPAASERVAHLALSSGQRLAHAAPAAVRSMSPFSSAGDASNDDDLIDTDATVVDPKNADATVVDPKNADATVADPEAGEPTGTDPSTKPSTTRSTEKSNKPATKKSAKPNKPSNKPATEKSNKPGGQP